MTAGTSMSDSTPPRDSASVKRLVPSAIAIARSVAVRPSAPAAGRNETIPPNPG